MKSRLLTAAVMSTLGLATVARAESDAPRPAPGAALGDIYRSIHAHPELSHQEARTSTIVAEQIRAAGWTVAERVGVYPDGSKAYGVVAVMKNGAGPTLLIRADMDALPITEETGVAYASHDRGRTINGVDTGVMHACGHDVHTTTLIGVARALAAAKARWHGTVMLVGQPSEETVDGAKAMLADHIYERFGRPDMIIGLHDSNGLAAGDTAIAIGPAQAGVTSVDVTIKGIGGHGAAPQAGRDPIVLAAQFITQLQTIVSREEDPQDPAVVTVGHITGGSKRNIIPDQVQMELTTRYMSDRGREVILNGIRNRAAGVALSAGLPPEKAPIVTVRDDESSPPLFNDPALSRRVFNALSATLGPAHVTVSKPVMPSEDVGVFGLPDHKIPVAYFSLGAMNPDLFHKAQAEGHELPGPHTSRFQPDPDPTLDTGVKAMTGVAISLMSGK